jgi:hypothetical protein
MLDVGSVVGEFCSVLEAAASTKIAINIISATNDSAMKETQGL